MRCDNVKYGEIFGIIGIVSIYILFTYLTYYPLKSGMFLDKKTNSYGINPWIILLHFFYNF